MSVLAAATVGDVLFWISNLAIVLGYTTFSAYVWLHAPGDVPRPQKVAASAFFFLCASTHVELAIHAITGTRLVTPDVPWHMVLIHVPQGLSIWLFIISVTKYGLTLGPLNRPGRERVARDR